MSTNLFKSYLNLVYGLTGLVLGISGTTTYHFRSQKHLKEYYFKTKIEKAQEVKDCLQAWEKYYQLDQPINQQYSEVISQKLNLYLY